MLKNKFQNKGNNSVVKNNEQITPIDPPPPPQPQPTQDLYGSVFRQEIKIVG